MEAETEFPQSSSLDAPPNFEESPYPYVEPDEDEIIPEPSKPKKDDDDDGPNRQPILKFFYFLFLLIGVVLQIYVFVSPYWFVSKDRFPPKRYVGLTSSCVGDACSSFAFSSLGHWAWKSTIILMLSAIVLLVYSTICALMILRRMKDYLLQWGAFAELMAGLILLAANIIFPFAFESAQLMPCHYAITEETAYHLCNPWTPYICVWLDIAAMIAFTIAGCCGSCITDKEEYNDSLFKKKPAKEEDEDETWYGGKKSDEDIAETSFNQYENAENVGDDVTDPAYMDPHDEPPEVMNNPLFQGTGSNVDSSIANPAYIDVQGDDINASVSNPAYGLDSDQQVAGLSNPGYRSTTAQSHSAMSNPGYQGSQPQTSDSYMDVEDPDAPSQQGNSALSNPGYMAGQQGDDSYMDVEQETQPEGPSSLANPGYGVQDQPADGAYMDVEEPDSHVQAVQSLSNPGYTGAPGPSDTSDSYMQVEDDDDKYIELKKTNQPPPSQTSDLDAQYMQAGNDTDGSYFNPYSSTLPGQSEAETSFWEGDDDATADDSYFDLDEDDDAYMGLED